MAFFRGQNPWWDYVNNFDPVGLGVDHTDPARVIFSPFGVWGRSDRDARWQSRENCQRFRENCCRNREDRRRAREEYRHNILSGRGQPCSYGCAAAAAVPSDAADGGRPRACGVDARRQGYAEQPRSCPRRSPAESDGNPLVGLFDVFRIIAAEPIAEAIQSALDPNAGGSRSSAADNDQQTANAGASSNAAASGRRASMNATVEDEQENDDVTAEPARKSTREEKGKQVEESEGNGVDSPAAGAAPTATICATAPADAVKSGSAAGIDEAGAVADGTADGAADATDAAADAITVDEQAFTPPLDLFDTEEAWVLHLAVPGAQKGDVSVDWDAERGLLTIAGVVHRPGDERFVQSLARAERRVGLFRRTLPLPPTDGALPSDSPKSETEDRIEVDGAAISAQMDNGLLVVTVPKLEREWTEIRSIDVL